MPIRNETFENGGFYHIFNKTIDQKKPYLTPLFCKTFLSATEYYRASDLHTPFAQYKRSPEQRKSRILEHIRDKNNFRVSLLEYCLMPNHYHFVLRQNCDHGINLFMTNLINSFTRYYNITNQRKGPLFLTQFKAVPVVTVQQLLTVCKYVNLNPLESGIVENFEQLRTYRWSSYKDYFSDIIPPLTQTDILLEYFNFNKNAHREFIEENSTSEVEYGPLQKYKFNLGG